MPDLSLLSSATSTDGRSQSLNPAGIPIEQFEGVAFEDMNAGTPVYVDSTTGKFKKADGSVAGTANVIGVTLKRVKAGCAVTVICKGDVEGIDLSTVAYGAKVYLSDTTGAVSDVAGTVSVVIGEVKPVFGQQLGNSPLKVLRVLR